MTNYEMNNPVITDLGLNGATGTAKQIQLGNIMFIYFDITLTSDLAYWTGLVIGMTMVDIVEFIITVNGVLLQVKPRQGFIQTAQNVSKNTRIVTSLFYVIP